MLEKNIISCCWLAELAGLQTYILSALTKRVKERCVQVGQASRTRTMGVTVQSYRYRGSLVLNTCASRTRVVWGCAGALAAQVWPPAEWRTKS